MKSLTGRKEIVSYTKRSWKLIRKWIENDNFPARNLGGQWESFGELIDEWKMKRINPPQGGQGN